MDIGLSLCHSLLFSIFLLNASSYLHSISIDPLLMFESTVMVYNLDKRSQHTMNWKEAYGICCFIIGSDRGMADVHWKNHKSMKVGNRSHTSAGEFSDALKNIFGINSMNYAIKKFPISKISWSLLNGLNLCAALPGFQRMNALMLVIPWPIIFWRH